MITAEEKEAAAKVPLVYKRAQFAANDAPYFVAVVRDYLREKYGDTMVYRGACGFTRPSIPRCRRPPTRPTKPA